MASVILVVRLNLLHDKCSLYLNECEFKCFTFPITLPLSPNAVSCSNLQPKSSILNWVTPGCPPWAITARQHPALAHSPELDDSVGGILCSRYGQPNQHTEAGRPAPRLHCSSSLPGLVSAAVGVTVNPFFVPLGSLAGLWCSECFQMSPTWDGPVKMMKKWAGAGEKKTNKIKGGNEQGTCALSLFRIRSCRNVSSSFSHRQVASSPVCFPFCSHVRLLLMTLLFHFFLLFNKYKHACCCRCLLLLARWKQDEPNPGEEMRRIENI